MDRQYIAVKFRPTDRKSFTYHYDNGATAPLAVGDEVQVPDKSGDGWKRVTVAAVDQPKPTMFATKPITGKFNPGGELIAPAAPAGQLNL